MDGSPIQNRSHGCGDRQLQRVSRIASAPRNSAQQHRILRDVPQPIEYGRKHTHERKRIPPTRMRLHRELTSICWSTAFTTGSTCRHPTAPTSWWDLAVAINDFSGTLFPAMSPTGAATDTLGLLDVPRQFERAKSPVGFELRHRPAGADQSGSGDFVRLLWLPCGSGKCIALPGEHHNTRGELHGVPLFERRVFGRTGACAVLSACCYWRFCSVGKGTG